MISITSQDSSPLIAVSPSTSDSNAQKPFLFMRLPSEIRNKIYELTITHTFALVHVQSRRKQPKNWHVAKTNRPTHIIFVSRQVYQETVLLCRTRLTITVCTRLRSVSARVLRPLAAAMGANLWHLNLLTSSITVEQINELFPKLKGLSIQSGMLADPHHRRIVSISTAQVPWWGRFYWRQLYPPGFEGPHLPEISYIRDLWNNPKRKFSFEHRMYLSHHPIEEPHKVSLFCREV